MALKTGNPSRSTVDPKLYSIYESPDKQGVDFFTEGQKLTKPIKETEERFIKEKAEDQKAFDERNKSLSEIDISQDQTFNALSLRYSQDMAANNMSDFDKVKRGEMSRTDFKIRQSNRSQSIATWGSTVKDYNKSFEAAQKRMQDGESGLQEQANMKGMAGFGNMANVVLIDDPNSAFGLMIELTDDEEASGNYPSYKEDPSRYVSATQANARMNQKIDKVNVVEKSKQYSETLGTTIKAYVGENELRTKEDFLLREGGNKLISDYAKAVIGEGNETASVLADNIGGYTFTTVKSEAGGKVIYQEIQENGNHIAILDEEQIQAAQEYTEGVLKAQLDIKETAKQTQQDNSTTAGIKKEEQENLGYVGNAVELQTVQTDADFKLVAEDIKSDINNSTDDFGPKIDSIKRDSDSFTFIIKNPDGSEEEKKVPRKDKNNNSLSMEDVSKGILKIIAPIEGSTDNAIELYRKEMGDDAFKGEISDVSGESIEPTKTIQPIRFTDEDSKVFTELGDTQDIASVSVAAGDLLNLKLRKLNMTGSVTIEEDFDMGGDGHITIKVPGVGEKRVRYDGENSNILQLVKTYVDLARKQYNAKGELDS
tara:strand:+ start:34073 stop:35863 length:1791 start_codon:yes stop_codon:yes gene_type:complete